MSITFRNAGAKAAGTGAVTPNLPSGISDGDICILVATTIAAGTCTITKNGSIDTWTALTGSPIDVTGGEKLYIWWGRYSSGSTGPTITPGGDHCCAGVAAWYDCIAAGSPINISNTGTETTSDTSFSFATGISTSVNNCMVLVICTSGQDSNTGQFPNAFTNANLSSIVTRMNYNTSSGGGGGFGLAEGFLATAGAIGTWATTLSNASTKAYISFALTPIPPSFTYSGDVPLTLETASTRKLNMTYGANLPLGLLTDSTRKLDRTYSADIPLTLLSSYTSALEKFYNGAIGFNLVPNSTYSLEEAIQEYIYNGNIALALSPTANYLLAFDHGYIGDITLSLLSAGLNIIVDRIYKGDVAVSLTPSYSRQYDMKYTGDLLIIPQLSSKTALDRIYGGDLSVDIAPSVIAKFDRTYNGMVEFSLLPNSSYDVIEILEFIYSGNIALACLLTSTGKFDRKYNGDIAILLTPDSIKSLNRKYQGDLGVVISPNSLSELYEALFNYTGNIPLKLLPSVITGIQKQYTGNSSLKLMPTAEYRISSREYGVLKIYHDGEWKLIQPLIVGGR